MADGLGKVTIAPKTLAPEVFYQSGKLSSQEPSGPTVERLHHIHHTVFGRNLKQQMDVIGLNVEFLQTPAIVFARLARQVGEACGNRFFKDPSAIFRDPDQMEPQAVGRVCTGPVPVQDIWRGRLLCRFKGCPFSHGIIIDRERSKLVVRPIALCGGSSWSLPPRPEGQGFRAPIQDSEKEHLAVCLLPATEVIFIASNEPVIACPFINIADCTHVVGRI